MKKVADFDTVLERFRINITDAMLLKRNIQDIMVLNDSGGYIPGMVRPWFESFIKAMTNIAKDLPVIKSKMTISEIDTCFCSDNKKYKKKCNICHGTGKIGIEYLGVK